MSSPAHSIPRLFAGLLLLLPLLLQPLTAAPATKDFANKSGSLPISPNLVERCLFHFNLVPKYTVPLKGIDHKKAQNDSSVVLTLQSLEARYGAKSSYTIAEVDSVMAPEPTLADVDAKVPAWRKVPGITEPWIKQTVEYSAPVSQTKVYSGRFTQAAIDRETFEDALTTPAVPVDRSVTTLGPFRLRRQVGPIVTDWMDLESVRDLAEIAAIEGAKVSYSNDFNVDGSGAWSTEGALVWPLHHVEQPTDTTAHSFHIGPAVSWKLEEKEKNAETDVNELKFSIPVAAHWQLDGGASNADSSTMTPEEFAAQVEAIRNSSELYLQVEPYLHTDTDFDGEIIGATASVEYRNRWLGHYRQLYPISSTRSVDWRLRLIGLADASSVEQGSIYISRAEDSDWFRLGAEAALEIALVDYDKKNYSPITATASYRFMETVSGEGGFSDLLKANLTFWANPYAGLTLEYQRGETPVADKDIDLLTVGLQLRY